MEHTEITAAVVAEIDRLLAEGRRHATIVKRVGVTRYVVEVIARDRERIGRPPPADSAGPRYPHRPNTADAATVRMIQRMLDVGILRRREIARETGVSSNFVTQVARGERVVLDTSRPPLSPGERFLRVPVRCALCRAKVSIVPCRACRARRESKSAWCM